MRTPFKIRNFPIGISIRSHTGIGIKISMRVIYTVTICGSAGFSFSIRISMSIDSISSTCVNLRININSSTVIHICLSGSFGIGMSMTVQIFFGIFFRSNCREVFGTMTDASNDDTSMSAMITKNKYNSFIIIFLMIKLAILIILSYSSSIMYQSKAFSIIILV